ncbi:MAG: APC family permease [Thermoleophilia bacterium]|nr:APC family permease [Thermoleophilia bacterium]
MGAQVGGGEKLGKGNLTLLDVIAQSIGFIGPVFAAAFFIPTIVGASLNGKGAGIASPVSIIIAMIGMCAVAWIISRFARRIHAAGSLYDYVTEAFGERIGFVAGWVYYGGVIALTLAIGLAFGGFLHDTLFFNHGVELEWFWYSIAFWVVAAAMMIRGVAISTRVQLVLGLGSFLIILAFSIWVIIKVSGDGGLSGAPFNPSSSDQGWNGIFFGVLYAVIMFIGFESSANLAEETKNPRKHLPLAIFGSCIAVGIFYIIVTYAQAVGFGLSVQDWLAAFPPLYSLAADPRFGSTNFGELVQWIVVIDIAAVGLGTAVGSSRGVFALARDGRLPKVLASVHPKYKTPWIASTALAVASIILIIIIAATNGLMTVGEMDPGQWFPMFNWLATFGGFMLVAVYIAICVAAFKGMPGESQGLLALAGIVGGLVSIGAIYGVIVQFADVPTYNRIWWVAALWLLGGVVVMLILNQMGRLRNKTV